MDDLDLARACVLDTFSVAATRLVPVLEDAVVPQDAVTVDPELAQIRMVPGGGGVIYSVQADGRLLWYRHTGWQTGQSTWANAGGGREIGTGWHLLTNVLAAQDGQLFGLCGDGTLRWHKYVVTNPETGEGYWAPNTPTAIASGFDRYAYLLGGWDGVIYAVDKDGNLWWFKYLAGDGSTGPGAWANDGRGALIGTGFKTSILLWADQNGVIYGVRQGGTLEWRRYLAGDGTSGPGAWANGGQPITIGSGWDWDSCVERFAMSGTLYAVYVDRARPAGRDHELHWYQLTNWSTVDQTGAPSWSPSNEALVGTGWTVCRTAALHGYSDRWSVTPGSDLNVAVSTTFPTYEASVLRLDGPLDDPANAQTVWGPVGFTGRLQLVQPGYRAAGCGWARDFSIVAPLSWKSGFHVVQLAGPNGLRRYIPFVVRPTAPVAKVGVMLPFLTHNAYNAWGGHNQYTWDNNGTNASPQTVGLRRPFANIEVAAPGRIDARFYSDLLLLKWLADNGIAYDCYQDTDLDSDGAWLGRYKALVLGSHPEYWTSAMRGRLVTYLGGGGRVIYTGGNGIYEPVDLSPDGSAAIHRNVGGYLGQRHPYRLSGLPEWDVLGVGYDEANGYMTFGPYQVVSDHPFLAGTGLTVGSQFGAGGYNLAASGWEIDRQPQPPVPGAVVIARGQQSNGSQAIGAEMVYVDKGNGGWVFGAGSLAFNGSLTDPAITALLKNVFTAALI